ncbi:ATP-binding cassette domain-containing protein [Microbacterium limosum]|uniref:ATP-binding cassette domain-containing protein n=1 Tax=Microbacterium limosum TaxID=3079935 RepID=A0AAU0MHG1_9MICO|nr:ATP-binding cassette domain-containing protein [Microbacterium sp. Y20]WOQ69907.1 ATP-binding cassette domain-containing protein [Microbacterium sp. Y20]
MGAAPAPPRPVAVTAAGWGWRYASRHAWALSGIDLRIEPGERVLLLGASGAGKSTLLHALAGVLGGDDEGDTTGSLTLDGVPAAHARGRAGMVLQDPDSQAILARVGDDVAFGCENLGVPRPEIWTRVGEALDAVGLDVPLDRSTSALSGGQKQRLALAGALAMRPGLLLLDEPTANLDPAGVAEVRDAVARSLERSAATLVVVEHRIDAWLPLVGRVIVLGREGVIADGSPDAVLGAHGPALAAGGVWVPDVPPRHPAPPAAEPGEVLLSGRDVRVGRQRGRPVAGPLSIDVRAGEVLGVTGPNGAGKSTLGLTLAGLLPPEGGEVAASASLAGGLGAAPVSWPARGLLTRIGTVLQDPEHQLLRTSVRAELEVGPRALRLPEAEVQVRVDELLARLRLETLAEANPYTLSGGEKRRLTVGAMLATRPRVLVLDEPTFGQDAVTWAELVALIARLRDEGAGIVAVTHDEHVLRALRARRLALPAQDRAAAA